MSGHSSKEWLFNQQTAKDIFPQIRQAIRETFGEDAALQLVERYILNFSAELSVKRAPEYGQHLFENDIM